MPTHDTGTRTTGETVLVPFSGARSGSAPMTWGQQAIWRSIAYLGAQAHYFNLTRVLAVPAGTSTDDVLGAVAALVARHEALRSTFTHGPDGPVQTVHGDGAVAATVHRTEPGAPGPVDEAGAQAVADDLAATAFRSDDEFGMRYAVLTHDARPVWVVLAISHQVADFLGVLVLEEDLSRLLRAETLEPVAWQPLDQARHQQEGEGARRGRAALAYWERVLTSAPASYFDRVPPPDETADDDPARFVRLRLESPAGAAAAQVLADRCRASTSTVLLTAVAMILAGYTGHQTAVLQLIAGNRNEPRLRRMVGAQNENALYAMTPGEGTFEDAVRSGFFTAMTAYRHGEYDPAALDEVRERVQSARGEELDLSVFFNDARVRDRWEALPDPGDDPAALTALRECSTVSFVGSWARQGATFFVHTPYAPDSLHLCLMADTHRVPAPVIEGLLRAMETLLVESVHGAVTASEALGDLSAASASRRHASGPGARAAGG